jgi:hypothetical protein
MGYRIGGYRATTGLLSICLEGSKSTTYMDRQWKAAVIYDCDLYLVVSILRNINLQPAYLNCISLNEAEFRSWSLSVDYQRGSLKA